MSLRAMQALSAHLLRRVPRVGVSGLMRAVLLAMLPGLSIQAWQFGAGVVIQLALAVATACLAEAGAQAVRRRPILQAIGDGSALVTAFVVAASVPPLLAWPLTVLATAIAILVGKHAYGGLGQNVFNPAMVGYAAVLVFAPQAMTDWGPSRESGAEPPGFSAAAAVILCADQSSQRKIDGPTGPTVRNVVGRGQRPVDQGALNLQGGGSVGSITTSDFESVNLGYLFGGLCLGWLRYSALAIPASLLGTLFSLSGVCFLLKPTSCAPPLAQLFAGGTMFVAFFVATDPVSAATTARGRWIYGALIGLLVFVIRSFGDYPDGIAFAVLLANLSAPTIDNWAGRRPANSAP